MERTLQRLREHYNVERELADRLRNASADERSSLYGIVYDELFRRVPDHPQLTRKAEENESQIRVQERMRLLVRFLRPSSVFLEIGAGDCRLSLEVARHVRQCFALEVSREIFKDVQSARNMELVLSNGCDIPLPEGSVTVAYSNQVIEHIHPDDAEAQLRSIHRALAKRGRYLCITPNRVNGPHDVSRYFDPMATGFHIKEYSIGDLDKLFRLAGFATTRGYVGFSNRYTMLPVLLLRLFETVLDHLPATWRKRLGNLPIVRNLLFISLVGIKK